MLENVLASLHSLKAMGLAYIIFKEWRVTRTFSSTECLIEWLVGKAISYRGSNDLNKKKMYKIRVTVCVCVAQYLLFSVAFSTLLFVFCYYSIGHWVVCPSSNYPYGILKPFFVAFWQLKSSNLMHVSNICFVRCNIVEIEVWKWQRALIKRFCFYGLILNVYLFFILSYVIRGAGRWFSLGTPVSSTNKTDRHNIAEILLKVALNTKSQLYTLIR
jgi:hypothetical protein